MLDFLMHGLQMSVGLTQVLGAEWGPLENSTRSSPPSQLSAGHHCGFQPCEERSQVASSWGGQGVTALDILFDSTTSLSEAEVSETTLTVKG